VGTGVLQLPLHEPLVVAKASATLQEVSGGRFLLGVGSGSHRREYERVGVDFTRRGRILDEWATLLDTSLAASRDAS
jgi:alkanesulfonate monooxygenase SsuD/methylene tetrahydromethanopterin reductase-like flavin-dependent oxidoreductase (luciferase family)